MRNIWTIAKREYDYYFISPIAYVILTVILGLLSLYFVTIMGFYRNNPFQGGVPNMNEIAGLFAFLMLFFIPALTMRLIADENRMGTIELLLTAPLRDSELVIGKWLGGFLFMFTMILITMIYPIIMNKYIEPGIDWGQIASMYLGLLLLSSALLGIGVGISAVFSNQIAALIATILAGLFLWWAISLPSYIASPSVGDVFRFLTMNTHVSNFMDGKITLAGVSYFLSLTALGLFTGTVAVESRRWR